MIVRIVAPGEFLGLIGTVDRRSASGGYWVRFAAADWPAIVPNERDYIMWFDRFETEDV